MLKEYSPDMFISSGISIRSAMTKLSSANNSPEGGKILFVINADRALIGSATDGDIRRGILQGVEFDRPVSTVMCQTPRSVSVSDANHRENARRLIVEKRLTVIPVLDESGIVIDLIYWHEFLDCHPEANSYEEVETPIVIMAGGKGTRLDPFTKIFPKPLIPVGDKPIIEKIMDGFFKYGFKNFVLSLNYRKDLIKMYLQDIKSPYNIDFIEEEKYLGTAGSLALLKDRFKETFYISNCDIIINNSDFREILQWHKNEAADITIIGYHNEFDLPYGKLEVNGGGLHAISEKPKIDMIVNTGVYIFEPHVLDEISPGEALDMNHLLERVMKHGKVSVFPIFDGWFDIGQWKEYKESLSYLQGETY